MALVEGSNQGLRFTWRHPGLQGRFDKDKNGQLDPEELLDFWDASKWGKDASYERFNKLKDILIRNNQSERADSINAYLRNPDTKQIIREVLSTIWGQTNLSQAKGKLKDFMEQIESEWMNEINIYREEFRPGSPPPTVESKTEVTEIGDNENAGGLNISNDSSQQTEADYSRLVVAKKQADQSSTELTTDAGAIKRAVDANKHFLDLLGKCLDLPDGEIADVDVQNYVERLNLLKEIFQLQNDTQKAMDAWQNNPVHDAELHKTAKSKYESLCQELAAYNPELYGENGTNQPPNWEEMVAGVVDFFARRTEFNSTTELSDRVTSALEKFNDAWNKWQENPTENNKQAALTTYRDYYNTYGEHKPQGLDTPQQIEAKINNYVRTRADLETAYNDLQTALQTTPPDVDKIRTAQDKYITAYKAHWGESPDTDSLNRDIDALERFLRQETEFNNAEKLFTGVSTAKTTFTALWSQWQANPASINMAELKDAYKAYHDAYNGRPPAGLAAPATVYSYIETGTRLHIARVNLERILTTRQWTSQNIETLRQAYEEYAIAYRAHYGTARPVTPSFEDITGPLRNANTVIINGTVLNGVESEDAVEIQKQLKIINDNQPKYQENSASFTTDCNIRDIATNIKNAIYEINSIISKSYIRNSNSTLPEDFTLQLDFIFCVNTSNGSGSPGNTSEHNANGINDIELGNARRTAFIDLLTTRYDDVNLSANLVNARNEAQIFLVVDPINPNSNSLTHKSDDYIRLELELYSDLPAIQSNTNLKQTIDRARQARPFDRRKADELLADLKGGRYGGVVYGPVNIALVGEERISNGLTITIPKRGAVSITSASVSDKSFYNVSRSLPAIGLNTPPVTSVPLPPRGIPPGQPPAISGLTEIDYNLPSIETVGVNIPNDPARAPAVTISLDVTPPQDPGRNIPPLCANIEDTIALPPQTPDDDQIVTAEKTYQLPITHASDTQVKPVLLGDPPEGITITDNEEVSPRAWIDEEGNFHTQGLPPGAYVFTYGLQDAEGTDIRKIGDGKITITVTQETAEAIQPVETPLNWFVRGDFFVNNTDGGRQQLEAGISYDRFSGQIYYSGNNAQTVQGLADQLIQGRIEWQAINQNSPEGRAALTIFGAVQCGVVDTKVDVTVAETTYRPTDELVVIDGKTEFSLAELEKYYAEGKISKMQYEDALNHPHQSASVSRGIIAGPGIPPPGANSSEYTLLPVSECPQKTKTELLAAGYTEDQIAAMTPANAAGYSAEETVGNRITVVAGQPNPDIAANPDAYKQDGEPYGTGATYTAKSASEAASQAAAAGQSGLPADEASWIRTPTNNTVYSDTPVKAEDLPTGVTPDMCIPVQPDPLYDTTRFDPASRSYTLEEVNADADPKRFGLTGGKIKTNTVIGYDEQTVSSIPAGANASDYIEVPPASLYGDIDINASSLDAAQLAAADPASFGPTGGKTGQTTTVQGSARPTADEYGTPYAESNCTANWGAVDSSAPLETIDWPPPTREDRFQYALDDSYPTTPPTILLEKPADDSEYKTNAHYIVQEAGVLSLDIAISPQANLNDDIDLTFNNLSIIEAVGGKVQISVAGETPITISNSPYDISTILKNKLQTAGNAIDIDIYIADSTGKKLVTSKLSITLKENGKKGYIYDIVTQPSSPAHQLYEIYELKGTRQARILDSWTVPVFEYKPRVQNPSTYRPPIYEEVDEYKLYAPNSTLYRAPTSETEYSYQLKAQDWLEKTPTEATYYEPQYEQFAPQQEAFSVRVFEQGDQETTILSGKNRDTESATVMGIQFEMSRIIINGKIVEITLNADGTAGYKITNFQRENNFSVENGTSFISNLDGTYTERTISGVPEEFTRTGGQIVYDMNAGFRIKFKEGPLKGICIWADGIIRKDAVSAQEQDGSGINAPKDVITRFGGVFGGSWGAGSLWRGDVALRYLRNIDGTDEVRFGIEQNFGEHFRAGLETDFQEYITALAAFTAGNGLTFTGSASSSIFAGRTINEIFGLPPTLSDTTNDPFFKFGTGVAYNKAFDNHFLTGLAAKIGLSYDFSRKEFEHSYRIGLGFFPTSFGRSRFELAGHVGLGVNLKYIGGSITWNTNELVQVYADYGFNPDSEQNKQHTVSAGVKFNVESKKP